MKTFQSFEIGDVVLLKSGGPAMTVYGVGISGLVACVWFIESGVAVRATFDSRTLVDGESLDDRYEPTSAAEACCDVGGVDCTKLPETIGRHTYDNPPADAEEYRQNGKPRTGQAA